MADCANNIFACGTAEDWLVVGAAVVVLIPLSIWLLREFFRADSVRGFQDSRGSVECALPGFLLPTGSGGGDFHCVFDFDAVVANVKPGIQVVTNVEVWAGRDDFERSRFDEWIRDEFARQWIEYQGNVRLNWEIDARISADSIEDPLTWRPYIHPVLVSLVEMFCEADHVPFSRPEMQDEVIELPDVIKHLRSPEYIRKVAAEYRPIVEV